MVQFSYVLRIKCVVKSPNKIITTNTLRDLINMFSWETIRLTGAALDSTDTASLVMKHQTTHNTFKKYRSEIIEKGVAVEGKLQTLLCLIFAGNDAGRTLLFRSVILGPESSSYFQKLLRRAFDITGVPGACLNESECKSLYSGLQTLAIDRNKFTYSDLYIDVRNGRPLIEYYENSKIQEYIDDMAMEEILKNANATIAMLDRVITASQALLGGNITTSEPMKASADEMNNKATQPVRPPPFETKINTPQPVIPPKVVTPKEPQSMGETATAETKIITPQPVKASPFDTKIKTPQTFIVAPEETKNKVSQPVAPSSVDTQIKAPQPALALVEETKVKVTQPATTPPIDSKKKTSPQSILPSTEEPIIQASQPAKTSRFFAKFRAPQPAVVLPEETKIKAPQPVTASTVDVKIKTPQQPKIMSSEEVKVKISQPVAAPPVDVKIQSPQPVIASPKEANDNASKPVTSPVEKTDIQVPKFNMNSTENSDITMPKQPLTSVEIVDKKTRRLVLGSGEMVELRLEDDSVGAYVRDDEIGRLNFEAYEVQVNYDEETYFHLTDAAIIGGGGRFKKQGIATEAFRLFRKYTGAVVTFAVDDQLQNDPDSEIPEETLKFISSLKTKMKHGEI